MGEKLKNTDTNTYMYAEHYMYFLVLVVIKASSSIITKKIKWGARRDHRIFTYLYLVRGGAEPPSKKMEKIVIS